MGLFSIELVYAFFILLNSFVFGSIMAYGSATLRIIKVAFGPLSTLYIGLFQAMPPAVAIFASSLSNLLLKKFTRKRCTMILAGANLVFWGLLMTMNRDYFWVAIIIRGLLGLTLAASSLYPPLYTIEIAPQEHKGFYGSLHPIFIILGHICTNLLGVTHDWRPPIYTCAASSLVSLIGLFFTPDSPFDIKQKESKEIENDIHMDDISANKNNETLSEEINEIVNHEGFIDVDTGPQPIREFDEKLEKEIPVKKVTIFSKAYCKETLMTFIMFFLPQFCGIAAINQNIAPMMSEVGLTLDAGFQAAIAISAQLVTAALCTGIIDKLGCKKLYVLSTGGTLLFLLLYALNIKFKWSNWLPMISLFGYQFSFGLGLSNVPWVLVPAIFPQELVSSALSLGITLNWLSASIVTFLFPYMDEWFGQFGLMLTFMGFNILIFLSGIFFIKDVPSKRADSEPSIDDIKANLINTEQGEISMPNEL